MPLISRHPLYAKMAPDWETMRDTYEGERAVKERGEKYLKPTAGMVLDNMAAGKPGHIAYDAYKSRALFHDHVRDGVEYYIGLMHSQCPNIELPDALEPLRDDATIMHESLEQLLRKINEQQLVAGRFGIMLDMPPEPDPLRPMPYIATYQAEAIINWDVGTREQLDVPKLNLVILDESTFKRNANFEWVWQEQYRVLVIGDPDTNESKGTYKQALFSGQNVQFDQSQLMAPGIRGKTLADIPFAFINATDNLPQPDTAPLMGLAKIALAIYRGEADYRQNLFMQGQDTLVIIGGKEDDVTRTGAGAVINLRAGAGVDAKYIGVTATGLTEQREALQNDQKAARNKAGQLIDTSSSEKESGEALQTRVAAQTATLVAIAKAGAAALEAILKAAAEWVGANPEDVKVEPNTEFVHTPMLPAELKDMMTAKTLGAPISLETVHDNMLKRGMTAIDYETEMDKLGEETPVMGTGTTAGGNPVLDAMGKPIIDPKTGKPTVAPGSPHEDPAVTAARTENDHKVAAKYGQKPKPKKPGAKK